MSDENVVVSTGNNRDHHTLDIRVVSLDETREYQIDEQDKPYIEKIMGIYMYDKLQHTFCCELRPSYWLVHLYDQVILSAFGNELVSDEADKIYEKYENCGGTDNYYHVSSIDHIEDEYADKPLEFRYAVYGEEIVEKNETTYYEALEAIREDLICNILL